MTFDEILQTRGGVLTAGAHGDCATGVCAMEARALLDVALAVMAVRVAAGATARVAADEAEVAVRAVAWAAAWVADEVKAVAWAVAWAADEAEAAAWAAVRAVARPAARAAEDTEAARAVARAVVWAAVRAANELPDAVLRHAIRIALETWNST